MSAPQPSMLCPSSLSSDRVCTSRRAGVAAPPVPRAQAPGCSSGSWTRLLQEFTCQMGIPTGFRVALQYGHNWNSSGTYTVGIPTGVWVKMWNREHRCNYLKILRTEEFEELLLAWMQSVLKHSGFHYWLQKKFYSKLPASQAQWSGWKRWEEEVLQLHDKKYKQGGKYIGINQ